MLWDSPVSEDECLERIRKEILLARGWKTIGIGRFGRLSHDRHLGLEERRETRITTVRTNLQSSSSSPRASLFVFFRGHNDKIFCLRWNPHQNEQFVTVGVKHIKFWTQAGGGMTSKQGIFGKSAGKQGKQNQMCVVFGKTADSCITGGGDGAIYIWTQTSLTRRVDKAHEGPLFAITAVQDKVRLETIIKDKRSFVRSFVRVTPRVAKTVK